MIFVNKVGVRSIINSVFGINNHWLRNFLFLWIIWVEANFIEKSHANINMWIASVAHTSNWYRIPSISLANRFFPWEQFSLSFPPPLFFSLPSLFRSYFNAIWLFLSFCLFFTVFCLFLHINQATLNNNFSQLTVNWIVNIYLSVCSCFSFKTVRTRVGLPSDGPDGRFSRILLCEPDSLPESLQKKQNKNQ